MTAVPDVAESYDLAAERKRLRRVAKLKDPAARAKQAHDIAHAAQTLANTLRVDRDHAGTALDVVHGWKPVNVYTKIGMSRTLYHKAKTRTKERGIREEYAQSEARAVEVASRPPTQVQEMDRFATEARVVRDAAIDSLLAGGDGKVLRNIEITKLLGLTSARIAQLRPEE